MMVALGADHAGFEYKEKTKELLRSMGVNFKDFGSLSKEPSDYPDFAHQVADLISRGGADYGILICGTGFGMTISANKHAGIRATHIESVEGAIYARMHNNINVLSIGSRLIKWDQAEKIIRIFLSTPFEGGRHQGRIEKIEP